MKVKVSRVTLHRHASALDGLVDYIAVPAGSGGLKLGVARDILSSIKKSAPVLSVYKSSFTWVVDAARKSDIPLIEYVMPVPSISAGILAEMLSQYGVRLGTVLEWDHGWRPEDPCAYARSLNSIASNIEYILIRGIEQGNPPLAEVERVSRCSSLLGVSISPEGELACRILGSGVGLLDFDIGGSSEDALARIRDTISVSRECSRSPGGAGNGVRGKKPGV